MSASPIQLRPTRRAALCALALAAGACNCGTKIRPVYPKIVVQPASLDFGSVFTGTTSQLPLNVTNIGQAPLFISSVTVANPGDITVPTAELMVNDCKEAHRDTANLMQLSTSECGLIEVQYSPSMVESEMTYILIASNDPETPVVKVPVTAAGAVAPAIQVCVLDTSGNVVPTACTDFSTTPATIPTLAFGSVPFGTPIVRDLRILDIGSGTLTVSSLKMQSSSSDLSLLDLPTLPASVTAGTGSNVEVQLNPQGNGTVSGQVVILSNDPKHPDVAIPVTAQEEGPCLQVTPTTMTFTNIMVGSSAEQALTVTNCGASSYQVTTLQFTGNSAFTVTSGDPSGQLPVAPFTFSPGQSHVLDLTFRPTAATPAGSPDTGEFTVVTSYGDRGTVPVTGTAVAPAQSCNGSAVAEVESNGAPVSNVLPLTTVTLNGTKSTPSTGATIKSYAWTLPSSPTNFGFNISNPTSATATLNAALAGSYEVQLTVTDSNDCKYTTTATFTVTPGGGVHVELTWNKAFGDLDLHYVGPGGSIFDNEAYQNGTPRYPNDGDVFWIYSLQSYCSTTDLGDQAVSASPEWGLNNTIQSPGNTTEDAALDVDQRCGHGPENITQPQPFDADFEVMVHEYCSGGSNIATEETPSANNAAIEATINVYFDGALLLTTQQSMTQNQVWDAATISVSGSGTSTTATVTPGSGGVVAGPSTEGCTAGGLSDPLPIKHRPPQDF